ncbi:protein DpdD [Sphingomonas floccifaciens]|uniref:Protein DpdD n=1 Tax=Sphingomonas floccifaciens TaxID=1844115 RepID=A0ABW4NHI9_9SPHN|nr:protein DpdD [Sphingomonas sp. CCH9-F2]
MIASEVEVARAVATHLRARATAFLLPAATAELCGRLLETAELPTFPGALIPEQLSDTELVVVAAATPSDWRRLSPVLRAFAGPTLTSFDGLPSDGLPTPELASILAEAGAHVSAIIRLPAEPAGRETALRALTRARDTLTRAPLLTKSAPEPTSWLLARFQDHLNVGRRDAAERVLERLGDELRLDALNLRALQVQLLATFEDWSGIVSLQGFANLVQARRTPATTAILLEALYRDRLAEFFAKGDRAAVERLYVDEVRALAAPMLQAPVSPSLRTGGLRIAGLEALTVPARGDLKILAASRIGELGWLAERLAGVPDPAQASPPAPDQSLVSDTADKARERLFEAEAVESVDAMAMALAALARLSEAQRAEIAQAEPFRSALRALQHEAGAAEVPTSWATWLARSSSPDFVNALDLARMGADEWSMGGNAADPREVGLLLDGLDAAQADPLAAERTSQALPYLVAALRRDPAFPNSALMPVYSSLLTLLALGSARGAATYGSSLVLVDALLSVGTDRGRYRELIADVDEIAGQGLGVDMAYWTLELVELFMRSAAPDEVERERLVHSILARLAPIGGRLSSFQQAAVRGLAQEFGWSLNAAPIAASASRDDLSTRLSDKSIAIYSLVENANRQAKAVLESLSSSVDVQLSSEHVGTSRLRALATNSDLFVIAWAAAKHAATDFIREHRGGRPLVYAEGKGLSSLLRAVEDFFGRSAD